MKLIFRVLLFILVFPLITVLATSDALRSLDTKVREQYAALYPDLSQPLLQHITVPSMDARHAFSSPLIPTLYARLEEVRVATIVTASIGLILVGLTAAVGYTARRRRDMLLRWFKPGLYVTLIGAAVITLAEVAELIYALYYYESIELQGVHVQILGFLGLGAVVAVFAAVRAMASVFKIVSLPIRGVTVDINQQPRLWAEVTGVATALNTPPPDNIILGLEPTFFVTETQIILGKSNLRGRTLYVSLGLSRLFTAAELRSVIGHELAHFAGDDTAYSKGFFPIYRSTSVAIAHLQARSHSIWSSFGRLPALAFMGYFHHSFMLAERNISRTRERIADETGARVSSPFALGGALAKVHAYQPRWKKIADAVRFDEGVHAGQLSVTEAFAAEVSAMTIDELKRAGSRQMAHPFDSHPSLEERLSALSVGWESLGSAASVPREEYSGWAVIDGAAELEKAETATMKAARR